MVGPESVERDKQDMRPILFSGFALSTSRHRQRQNRQGHRGQRENVKPEVPTSIPTRMPHCSRSYPRFQTTATLIATGAAFLCMIRPRGRRLRERSRAARTFVLPVALTSASSQITSDEIRDERGQEVDGRDGESIVSSFLLPWRERAEVRVIASTPEESGTRGWPHADANSLEVGSWNRSGKEVRDQTGENEWPSWVGQAVSIRSDTRS